MKKTPAPKRKPAPRKAKKPAKRKAKTRTVTLRSYECPFAGSGVDVYAGRRWLIGLCREKSAKFFDVRGMKPGDVRRLRITTEVVE